MNVTNSSNTGKINFYTYDPFTYKWLETFRGGTIYETDSLSIKPTIDKIVYLKDRTITVWNDGSTVEARRMENDSPNREHSLFVCILKKLYGSWSNVEEKFLAPYIENAKVIEP